MTLQYSTSLRTAQVSQIEAKINGADVTPWAQSTAYAQNAVAAANGAVYKANTGGTSAATGNGPSGTGSSITDGTNGLTWEFQAATLVVYSGAEPANVAASSPSGVLCTMLLPATSLTTSAGSTTISGSWQANASATGIAASWRIFDGAGNCHLQGNVTSDLILDNTNIATNQTVNVTGFSVTAANQ